MYRLFIDDSEIELEKNTELSFTKENSIFAFGDITLNRTLSFKIPRTPTNDNIFGLAHLPEYSGNFVRSIGNAALWYSGGSIDGEIMITEYSDKKYNAVFIYGVIEILRKLSEAGTLEDELNFTESVFWGTTNPPQNPNGIANYGIARYFNRMGVALIPKFLNLFPSIRVSHILQKIQTTFSVTINDSKYSNYINSLFLKQNSVKGKVTESFTLNFDRQVDPEIYIIYGGKSLSVVKRKFYQKWMNMFVEINGLKANTDITFDIDFSQSPDFKPGGSYYPLGYGVLMFDKNMEFYTIMVQILNRWFNENSPLFHSFAHSLNPNNAILSYSGVKMKSGDEIYFQPTQFIIGGPSTYDGLWNQLNAVPFNINYKAITNSVSIYEKMNYNSDIELKYNAPKITVFDFLLSLKNLTNSGLIFEKNNVELFNFDFSNETPIVLDNKLIQIKKIDRNVFDFAQENYKKFNSLKYVTNNVIETLIIDNETIKSENDLIEIPYSETDKITVADGSYSTKIVAFSDDLSFDGEEIDINDEGDCEIMIDEGGEELKQVNFFENNFFKKILEKSTTSTSTFFMTLFEYQQIKEKTTFLLKNKKYSWSAAKWQKNIAELTLILID